MLRVGRIQRHPLVPRAGEEGEVARVVHLRQQGLVEGVGCLDRPERAALQLGQHVIDAVGRLEAGHQLAAEHLEAALVQGVAVVEDRAHAVFSRSELNPDRCAPTAHAGRRAA